MSLPSGYKRLEYIQSSGTQYVDTLFKPNSNTKFVVDLQISNNACHVFGARTSYLQKALCLFWKSNSAAAIQVGNTQFDAGAFAETVRHQVTMTATELYMDGNLQKSYSTDYFQCEQNAWLMSCYSSSESEYASGKLYSCQIYDNGTLIRDFIPCQKLDGIIGLWDDVNSTFYGNAGTGTFIAGPVIAIAADKSEITKLEYIQSSGTQWIDTGVKAKNNTKVIADCEITYGTGWVKILGSYEAGVAFSWWANASNIYAYYGTEEKLGVGATGKHILTANGNMWSDSVNDFAFSYSSFTATRNLYLFSVNGGGTYDNAPMKLYSCQIYDNGTLVRDFIAAKLSDGTVGLYDKLSGLLYINAGTGTFEAGPSSLNLPVNIGGTWKDANEVFVNIGGTWKAVEAAFVNIGGTWKELG